MQWPLGEDSHFSLSDQPRAPSLFSFSTVFSLIAVQFAVATTPELVPNQQLQVYFRRYR